MRENLYENEMIHKLKKLNAGMPSEAELWLALQCTPSSNSSIPSKKLEKPNGYPCEFLLRANLALLPPVLASMQSVAAIRCTCNEPL